MGRRLWAGIVALTASRSSTLFDWSKRGMPGPDLRQLHRRRRDDPQHRQRHRARLRRNPRNTPRCASRSASSGRGAISSRPAPCDWNKDGKPDLLVGEGSYSANAVYVLLNQSGGSEPKFTEEQRYYLCYGDGREQLVPDGRGLEWRRRTRRASSATAKEPSASISIRANWKPGTELPLATMVKFGNVQSFRRRSPRTRRTTMATASSICSSAKPAAASLSRSTKARRPSRSSRRPSNCKAPDIWANNIRIPAKWTIDPGTNRGESLWLHQRGRRGEPRPAARSSKPAYFPSPNKVFKMVELAVDGRDDADSSATGWIEWVPIDAPVGRRRALGGYLRHPPDSSRRSRSATTYQLSFKTKGGPIQDGVATVAYLGANENKPHEIREDRARGRQGDQGRDQG